MSYRSINWQQSFWMVGVSRSINTSSTFIKLLKCTSRYLAAYTCLPFIFVAFRVRHWPSLFNSLTLVYLLHINYIVPLFLIVTLMVYTYSLFNVFGINNVDRYVFCAYAFAFNICFPYLIWIDIFVLNEYL